MYRPKKSAKPVIFANGYKQHVRLYDPVKNQFVNNEGEFGEPAAQLRDHAHARAFAEEHGIELLDDD